MLVSPIFRDLPILLGRVRIPVRRPQPANRKPDQKGNAEDRHQEPQGPDLWSGSPSPASATVWLSAPARIVNVSSAGQRPIDFDDVMLTRGYSGTRAYCQSKLAQIMFTIDLAAALEATGVTVTCLPPPLTWIQAWCGGLE